MTFIEMSDRTLGRRVRHRRCQVLGYLCELSKKSLSIFTICYVQVIHYLQLSGACGQN
ncbi:hypothetical protein ACEYW6_33425 [Nostoc sp. UIC 10607]